MINTFFFFFFKITSSFSPSASPPPPLPSPPHSCGSSLLLPVASAVVPALLPPPAPLNISEESNPASSRLYGTAPPLVCTFSLLLPLGGTRSWARCTQQTGHQMGNVDPASPSQGSQRSPLGTNLAGSTWGCPKGCRIPGINISRLLLLPGLRLLHGLTRSAWNPENAKNQWSRGILLARRRWPANSRSGLGGEGVRMGWATSPCRTSPASHIFLAVYDYYEFSSWTRKTWPQPFNSTVAARRTMYSPKHRDIPSSTMKFSLMAPQSMHEESTVVSKGSDFGASRFPVIRGQADVVVCPLSLHWGGFCLFLGVSLPCMPTFSGWASPGVFDETKLNK